MTQDNYERAREALSCISPEDRDIWVRMAMAIKSEFGDEGFDLWDEWSRGAENYSASSARTVWKGIQEAGAITIASLFYEARQHGWSPSGSYRPREMTDAERGERERRMREAEEQRKRDNARARELGQRIFRAGTRPAENGYLERKRVEPTDTLRQIPVAVASKVLGYEPQANGEKLEGNLLVVPLKAGADFAGVELIDDQGRKSTPYGTAAKGAYWSPEPLPDGDGADRRVLIGEGVATMLSARQALPGDVCIAARFAGNLPAVAEAMRNRYPQARLVILGERGGGWRFAERAARVCGGLLADFTGDANDLHKLQGLDAVRVVIGAAQEPTEDALQDAQSGSDTPTDQPARLNGSKGALASLVEPVAHLRRGDEIKLQPVRWLMPDFLPCGKVVLIGGQPGTGKTTAAIALAAAVSCGGRFPDGSRPEAADVLLWSGEDSIDDTLAGRFKAAGADMSRVHFVDGVDVGLSEPRYFDPAQDVGSLRAAVDKLKAANPAFNPRVVIVDPIVSAVQGDSHKNSEVRRALQPLVDFADRSGAVVLGITHFSKGTQGREPIERITGSLAFAALARVVLVCAKMDEAEGGGRVLVRSKNNLGKDGGGFRYDLGAVEVEPGITASRVLWGDPIEGTAREILATAEDTQDATDRGETQSAAEWLRATLEGGELTKLQVMERGREAGFSDRTLQRARQRIGAKAEVVGFGTQKRSIWRMPEGAPETEPARQSCQPAPIHANPKAGANGHVWDAVGTHGAVEVLDGPPWEPPGDPKPADAEAL